MFRHAELGWTSQVKAYFVFLLLLPILSQGELFTQSNSIRVKSTPIQADSSPGKLHSGLRTHSKPHLPLSSAAATEAELLRELPNQEAIALAHRDLRDITDSLQSHPQRPDWLWRKVRLLHVIAVSESQYLEQGEAFCDTLSALQAGGSDDSLRILAYRGAFMLLRAKHAIWPPDKWKYLKNGLVMLDAATKAHPHSVEIRYLRLVSCFYLPFFFGRQATVKEDFKALAEGLPKVSESMPARWYLGLSRFVLKHAALSPTTREPLLRSSLQVYSRLAQVQAGVSDG